MSRQGRAFAASPARRGPARRQHRSRGRRPGRVRGMRPQARARPEARRWPRSPGCTDGRRRAVPLARFVAADLGPRADAWAPAVPHRNRYGQSTIVAPLPSGHRQQPRSDSLRPDRQATVPLRGLAMDIRAMSTPDPPPGPAACLPPVSTVELKRTSDTRRVHEGAHAVVTGRRHTAHGHDPDRPPCEPNLS